MKGDRARSEIYRLAALLYPRSASRRPTGAFGRTSSSRPSTRRSGLCSSRARSRVKARPQRRPTWRGVRPGGPPGPPGGRRPAQARRPRDLRPAKQPRASRACCVTSAWSSVAVAQVTEQGGLRVVTTGPLPPNPAELLGSQRMRTTMDRLKSSEDLVIFDSPPLQAVTDSAILSSFVDVTLFVIDAGEAEGAPFACPGGAGESRGQRRRGRSQPIPAWARPEYADYYGRATARRRGWRSGPQDAARRLSPSVERWRRDRSVVARRRKRCKRRVGPGTAAGHEMSWTPSACLTLSWGRWVSPSPAPSWQA